MIALPVLKLFLAPAFIALITLAGRRWGPALAGFLAGLPVAAGPVSFFVALEQGPAFASSAAAASIASLGMTALFCLTYARMARRRAWWLAILASVAVFFAGAVLLHGLALGLWPAAALVLVCMFVTAPRFPVEGTVPPGRLAPPRFDLAWRMAAVVCLTLAVTGMAEAIGPRWTGLFTTFPVVSTVLAVFSHRSGPHGPVVAARLLRALVLGLGSTVAFFLVIGLWLPTLGVAAGYSLAVLAALSVQGATALPTLLRRRAAA